MRFQFVAQVLHVRAVFRLAFAGAMLWRTGRTSSHCGACSFFPFQSWGAQESISPVAFAFQVRSCLGSASAHLLRYVFAESGGGMRPIFKRRSNGLLQRLLGQQRGFRRSPSCSSISTACRGPSEQAFDRWRKFGFASALQCSGPQECWATRLWL